MTSSLRDGWSTAFGGSVISVVLSLCPWWGAVGSVVCRDVDQLVANPPRWAGRMVMGTSGPAELRRAVRIRSVGVP